MFYTNNLMFRNWNLDADLNTMVKLKNDLSDCRVSMNMPVPTSQSAAKEWAEVCVNRKEGLPCFAICERPRMLPEDALGVDDNLFVTKDGKARYPMIGVLTVFNRRFQYSSRVVSLGIWIDAKFRRRGLATEAVAWGCKYIFHDLGLHKIEVDILADNVASRALFTAAGFTLEGTHRSSFWWDGKWDDSVFMGLIEDEWREKQMEQGKERSE